MSLQVKTGDTVKIIAGKDKGSIGKILSVNIASNRVIVDNANIVTKHVKAKGANEQGGIRKEPSSIDASNVQIVCPSCSKSTRIAKKDIDGKKHRACKKCGASLDTKQKVSAAKVARKAKKDDKIEDKTKAKTDKVDKVEKTADKKPVVKADKPAAKTTAAKKPVAKAADKKAEPKKEKIEV